ncbi:hypothetical protein ACUBGW_27180, partial [Escherichia coli]|nr:hypothetical protein [Escherichia coli]MCK3083650.1 hypothetical protein [Escherichia coli]
RNRSHWSTSKTPSYTKSVSWQHHQKSCQLILPVDISQKNKCKKAYFVSYSNVIYHFVRCRQHQAR